MRLSGPTAIHDAVQGARVFAEHNGIAEDSGARLAIVVEELVTNLYEHGGLSDVDPLEIELALGAGAIHLVIADQGEPFDPRTARQGNVPARGGGAGLSLVRSWASATNYESSSGTNRLRVILPLR